MYDDLNILATVDDFHQFTVKLCERKVSLTAELSRCDKEICDIQHAAEFFSLNAAQGYKLYKMLHDVTVERRAIKDEMQRIDIVLDNLDTQSINSVKKRLKGLDNRSYKPRVLKELFES